MKLIQHVEVEPDWPEFGFTFEGKPIRLTEVEETFPAGSDERASVYYLSPKEQRTRVYPWKEAGYCVDDAGEPLAPVGVPLRARMAREELEALGLDDVRLDELHASYFGRDLTAQLLAGQPDDVPLQELRRRRFDEATERAYAPTSGTYRRDGG